MSGAGKETNIQMMNIRTLQNTGDDNRDEFIITIPAFIIYTYKPR